LNMTMSSLY